MAPGVRSHPWPCMNPVADLYSVVVGPLAQTREVGPPLIGRPQPGGGAVSTALHVVLCIFDPELCSWEAGNSVWPDTYPINLGSWMAGRPARDSAPGVGATDHVVRRLRQTEHITGLQCASRLYKWPPSAWP